MISDPQQSPSDIDLVREILQELTHIEPAHKLAHIHARTGHSSELAAEILALLRFDDALESFLDTSIPESLGLAPPPCPILPAGTVLKNRYRIQRLLAEGGSAIVYLAADQLLADRPTVIKDLENLAGQPALAGILAAEIHSTSRLSHPNLRGIIDRGETPAGTPFLVLEYVDGITLRQLLSDEGELPLARVQKFVAQIASALAAAHRLDICHLDLKPENIIITEPGAPFERAIVIDFGIAAIHSLSGTAPECLAGPYHDPHRASPPDASSDIYSLAVITRELLGPALPPPHIAHAIACATSSDLAHRPPSIQAFAASLAAPSSGFSRWLPSLVAAAVLLVIIAVAAFVHRTPGAVEPVRLVARPLVTAPGLQREGALSADGAWLYYTSGDEGHSTIYRVSTATRDPQPIVQHLSHEHSPSPSPDGKWLAFLRGSNTGAAIVLRPLDPPGPEQILAPSAIDPTLSWHPGGTSLFVSAQPANNSLHRLFQISLATPRWEPLFSGLAPSLDDCYPAASPNGKTLSFVRKFPNAGAEIFVVTLGPNGLPISPARPLTHLGASINRLQWMPDGKSLVALFNPWAGASLRRVAFPSGAIEPLKINGEVSQFAIAAGARKMVVTFDTSDSNIWRLALAPTTTPALLPIAHDSYGDGEAHYSHDGQSIVFISGRGGSGQVWIANADGSAPRQVTHLTETFSALTAWFAPGDRQLLFSTRSAKRKTNTYTIDRTGASQPKLLLEDAFVTYVSRRSQWIYFFRATAGLTQIWRAPFSDPTSQQQLTASGGQFAIESTDGAELYFARRDQSQGVFRLPLPPVSPPPAPLPVAPSLRYRNLFATSSRGLYFIDREGQQRYPGLFLKSKNSSALTLIHRFDRDVSWGLDLSPNEEYLLLSLLDITNSDLYLVDDIP